jgi:hypothetical protein
MQLMQLFSDTAPAPRTPIAFSVTGDTSGTLDHLLFQRSNGSYLLVLWLAQPVYDPSTRAVLPVASENLDVSLPASVAAATLTAFGDNGASSVTSLTATNGSVVVPVRSTVSVLEFRV